MDPSMLPISAFILIWTSGLYVGMAYLRGGRSAVRRVARQLAVIIPIAALFLLAESVVMNNVGAMTVGLVLLPVMLFTLARQIRRYRHLRATAPDDVRAAIAFTPAIRNFAIAAIAVMLVGSILVAFLASKAGL
jgi:predicted MFS family arabinose efflux permease